MLFLKKCTVVFLIHPVRGFDSPEILLRSLGKAGWRRPWMRKITAWSLALSLNPLAVPAWFLSPFSSFTAPRSNNPPGRGTAGHPCRRVRIQWGGGEPEHGLWAEVLERRRERERERVRERAPSRGYSSDMQPPYEALWVACAPIILHCCTGSDVEPRLALWTRTPERARRESERDGATDG